MKVPVTIYIDHEVKEKGKEDSKELKISLSQHIENLLKEYFKLKL